MTTYRRDGQDTPFENWIRHEPRLDSIRERLSVIDNDYWIHQYRAHTDKIGERKIDSIMNVELKTFQAQLPFAQRDTLALVSAVHRHTMHAKDGKIKTIRIDQGHQIRRVRWYGYFVLRLQNARPDDGGWIEWHGKQIDMECLIDVLCFKRDPRTLRKRSDRRHHTLDGRQMEISRIAPFALND